MEQKDKKERLLKAFKGFLEERDNLEKITEDVDFNILLGRPGAKIGDVHIIDDFVANLLLEVMPNETKSFLKSRYIDFSIEIINDTIYKHTKREDRASDYVLRCWPYQIPENPNSPALREHERKMHKFLLDSSSPDQKEDVEDYLRKGKLKKQICLMTQLIDKDGKSLQVIDEQTGDKGNFFNFGRLCPPLCEE